MCSGVWCRNHICGFIHREKLLLLLLFPKHVIEPNAWEVFIAWYFSRVSTLSQFARRYFTRTRKDVWCPPFFVKMLGLTYLCSMSWKQKQVYWIVFCQTLASFWRFVADDEKEVPLWFQEQARIGRIVFNLLEPLPGDGIWCFHTHSVFSSNMHLSCLQ